MLEECLEREELIWKQKGKTQWLREGDRNTSFFHSEASERHKHNMVSQLLYERGAILTSQEDIQKAISDYFHDIFCSTKPEPHKVDEILGVIEPRVTEEVNKELLHPYTIEEVNAALNQMYPFKAPGLDGMSPAFYQFFWYIVGNDITACVLDMLNNQNFRAQFNFTHIVLIPKCINRELVS
ncbi:UNVERIFIED_CONTAM: hypothetical protein Sangu_2471600 [Sesamum angustifolium]|uniref:Reverse transcriptase n=1 Tax=Sesamum angustifolium TaxID=2727405 RepID=A0AAW2IZ11_9LAMI